MQGINSQQCRKDRTIIDTNGTGSILSSTLTYIQYDRHPKNYHSFGISAMNKCGKTLCTKEERDILELDFGQTPDIKESIFRCVQSHTVRNIKHYKI